MPPLAELVAPSYLAERRLLEREADDRLFDLRGRPVPQIRLPAELLDQCLDAALLDRLLVPVERVAGVAHDLAGLRHVAELLGPPQQANLVFGHRSMCTHLGVPFWSIRSGCVVHNQGNPASSAAEEVSDHIATTATEATLGVQMDTDGARRLNRSSPSSLNSGTQRTDFFHGLLCLPPHLSRWPVGL